MPVKIIGVEPHFSSTFIIALHYFHEVLHNCEVSSFRVVVLVVVAVLVAVFVRVVPVPPVLMLVAMAVVMRVVVSVVVLYWTTLQQRMDWLLVHQYCRRVR